LAVFTNYFVASHCNGISENAATKTSGVILTETPNPRSGIDCYVKNLQYRATGLLGSARAPRVQSSAPSPATSTARAKRHFLLSFPNFLFANALTGETVSRAIRIRSSRRAVVSDRQNSWRVCNRICTPVSSIASEQWGNRHPANFSQAFSTHCRSSPPSYTSNKRRAESSISFQ